MRLARTVLVLGLLLGLAGCGSQPTAEWTFQSPLSPTGGPVTGNATPTPLPTAQAGMGGATGQIVDATSGLPVAQTVFYLGDLTPLEGKDGVQSSAVVMIPGTSPSFQTDDEGKFTVVNVEPGTYAVVVWTPMSSSPLTDPDTDKAILITIEPDEVSDAGIIRLEQ